MEEKYSSFYEELQALLNSRLLSVKEMKKYVDFIESSGMEKDAFLMIVNFCIELKDPQISAEYILTVAKHYEREGFLTAKQIEEKLSENMNRENGQRKESFSQEEYLIKLFRKLNPKLKKNVIDIVKGLTTSLDNK